ncbi:MAG: hypothetical protein ACTSRP_03755 [Candidatus Helarchaeota archaeon]
MIVCCFSRLILISAIFVLTVPKIINHWYHISELAILTFFIDNRISRKFFQKPKLIV